MLDSYFQNYSNLKYFYVTYKEFLGIFDEKIDPTYLPSINKKIVHLHLNYFNYSYEQMWGY